MTTPAGAGPAPLPPIDRPCPKCGAEGRSLVWVPAAGDTDVDHAPLIRLEPREHMQVTCSTCGFMRAAAPADSG